MTVGSTAVSEATDSVPVYAMVIGAVSLSLLILLWAGGSGTGVCQRCRRRRPQSDTSSSKAEADVESQLGKGLLSVHFVIVAMQQRWR